MRSCILWHRGEKASGPSGWVPVWVTLYPGGLEEGDQGERGEGKALPIWPVDM